MWKSGSSRASYPTAAIPEILTSSRASGDPPRARITTTCDEAQLKHRRTSIVFYHCSCNFCILQHNSEPTLAIRDGFCDQTDTVHVVCHNTSANLWWAEGLETFIRRITDGEDAGTGVASHGACHHPPHASNDSLSSRFLIRIIPPTRRRKVKLGRWHRERTFGSTTREHRQHSNSCTMGESRWCARNVNNRTNHQRRCFNCHVINAVVGTHFCRF